MQMSGFAASQNDISEFSELNWWSRLWLSTTISVASSAACLEIWPELDRRLEWRLFSTIEHCLQHPWCFRGIKWGETILFLWWGSPTQRNIGHQLHNVLRGFWCIILQWLWWLRLYLPGIAEVLSNEPQGFLVEFNLSICSWIRQCGGKYILNWNLQKTMTAFNIFCCFNLFRIPFKGVHAVDNKI